jgi:protein ImuB
MRIPSYDDLTPSIPDISPADVLASVVRLLPASGPITAAARNAPRAAGPAGALFACIRSNRASDNPMAIARDFSPRIERYGTGCVVLDVSGLGRLLGDAQAIGAELVRAGACRLSIAPTQVAAMLLALGHAGLTVAMTDAAEAAVGELPLSVLRALLTEVHAVTDEAGAGGQSTRSGAAHTRRARGGTHSDRTASPWPSWLSCMKSLEVLQRWGLTTLRELTALPAGDLSARLGQAGPSLQRLARGVDPRPLVPDPGVPRFVQAIELEWPIDGLEPLSFVLARLLEPLSIALEQADRGAAALRLDLRLTVRTSHARVLQLPAAMRDARVLRTLLLLDLESHPPHAAIDIVTIEIDPAPARVVQYSLLERAMPSVETLATLNARLGALVGASRCGSAALLDTHRPDGFEMRRFAPDAGRRTSHVAPHIARGTSHAAPPLNVARCTPHVSVSLLPPTLRRFRPPVAVRVTVEHGAPVRVAVDRRGMPGGGVEQRAGPWRTSGAWWETDGAGWDRDEWDVALSDGSMCRLFHDRRTERWFLDGVLD